MHDLDALNLTSIPPEVYELTDLKELSARENSLTELPSDLTKLTNLEILWLHENNISEVSPGIGQLKNLKELWLNDNSIPRLPNEICFLGALTDLRLHSNKLTLLPHEFGLLTSLTRLSLSDNQLIGLPTSIANLTSLKKLVADGNRFAVFPQALPSSLTTIDFSNNKIGGEVPPPNMIPKLADVRKLRLSHNFIYAIPGEIGSLAKLEVLSLSSNQLFTLPPSLGACTGLRVLELDDNKVDYLPPEISIMTRLEKLGVNNTSFLNVPPAVVKKGQKAIVKYFQDFRQETRDCCRIKLMVVGQENVGKSTLLQALRNTTKTISDHSTPLSTDGIDIVTWKVKPDKTNNKKIEFSCWDFAGQEVYYNTHQFFLSKNAIYVLVWNLASPDTARLDFWLESIEGSGGGVVVMVGTHLNDPLCTTEYLDAHFASIEEKCLKKFPNIRFVSAVDAKKGQGIEELKKNLVELARTLPQFGKAMPSTYIRLEEAIEKEAKARDPPLMTWQDYKTLAVSCSINDDETLATATQFFHNLGSLIHFPSRHSGLADLVILKPQFLPNLMCTIISTKATFVKNGVLEHKDLSFVWKKYNAKFFPQFILLLEKFGILCRLQEESSSNKLSVVFLSPGGSPPGSPTSGRRSLQSPPSSPTVKNYTTVGTLPTSPSSMSGSLKKRLSMSGGMEKPKAALDAEKSLIPLLLEHNPEIEKLAKHVQRDTGTLGRDFFFRIIIPSLFPRLIVSVLTYSRLASRRALMDIIATPEQDTTKNTSSRSLKKEKNIRVEYSGYRWKVEYGKDQLYVARRDSYALATFSHKERKLSVLVWGNNTTRMLALITQSVEFLLEDCFPNHKFTVSVVCPHCLANNAPVPKKWPMSDLETQLLTEGDTATVLCDNTSESGTRSPDRSPMSSSASTLVLVREMIPDLALNEVPKINFDDLKMECQIGEGAFGEIWRARYKDRVVAIKKVRGAGDSLEGNKDSFTEFVREVAFMSQMHSPEMVQLIGVGLKPLSMMQEFMELGDLQKYLRSAGAGRLDLKTVAKIAFDISKGCQFLHSQTPPCIHADLKSPNILLTLNEKGDIVAKLGDLGLSRSVFAPLNKRMVDNPRWLAPEILAGQEYNEMADVYSYGIILWEIVTTHLDKYQEPFEEFRLNFDSLLEVHIMQGLRPTIPIGTPHELGTVINDCWQMNYFERPTFDGVALTMSNYCLSVK